jgi:hypothetical protein
VSYHNYLKALGNNPKDVPHIDLESENDRFHGFASLYLHPVSGEPMYVSWYLWDGDDDENYIREAYRERGYDLSALTAITGGNGHYSMYKPSQD